MYILGRFPPYNQNHLGWATGGLVTIICPDSFFKEGDFQFPSQ